MDETTLLKIIHAKREDLLEVVKKLGTRGKMEDSSVIRVTADIVEQVRQRGDRAALEFTRRYDNVELVAEQLVVSPAEIRQGLNDCDPDLLEALRTSARQIEKFHAAQLGDDLSCPTEHGGEVGLIQRPLAVVGAYVPGGSAPLPSSVLMNLIPARCAGVKRIILCTPPRKDGSVDPAILAAAHLAGADEIYRVGGAQAIAALAFGTETIPAVDKIVGPGNIYVNMAKRLVFGQVDIDMFAGPSEILIIADQKADPAYVAADLLSQAEHDPLASALLLTTSESLARATANEISRQLPLLSRQEIIRSSLTNFGAALVVPDLETAFTYANQIAPEHLELMLEDAKKYLPLVQNAGAVFLGAYSPEVLGDYFAGPNHVLPTSGTARFFSPLSTSDFIKTISVIHYTKKDLEDAHVVVALLADAEKLGAHAASVRMRFLAAAGGLNNEASLE